MVEIWVGNVLHGQSLGTKEAPFVVNGSAQFDALMRKHAPILELTVHLNGFFQTAGTRQWNDSPNVQENPGFRIKNWTFDTETSATLQWDVDAVPDDRISDEPIHLVCTTEARFDVARLGLHTGQEVWDMLPRGQKIRNITVDLQFAKAAARWKARGKRLRIGAVLLAGHQAAIEKVRVINFGALGFEGFPLIIAGAVGQYDRDLIATLDPATHIFDDGCSKEESSHITDCLVEDYAEAASDDQVSVFSIWGSKGEKTPGELVYHFRRWCYETGNKTLLPGCDPHKNLVQGHTIYGCLGGLIARNHTLGAYCLAYGDFDQTKDLEVSDNVAEDALNIARYLLSPVSGELGSKDFRIEGLSLLRNKGVLRKSGTPGHAGIVIRGDSPPSSPTRYIRRVLLDANNITILNGQPGSENRPLDISGVEGLRVLNSTVDPKIADRILIKNSTILERRGNSFDVRLPWWKRVLQALHILR